MARSGIFWRVFGNLCPHLTPRCPGRRFIPATYLPVPARPTIRHRASSIMERAMSPRISIYCDALSAFCRRHHIARLALFGSVLCDDFAADSDIDVFVEFQPGHVPGLDFMTIEREFSSCSRVDAWTWSRPSPSMSEFAIRFSRARPRMSPRDLSTSGTCSTWRGRRSAKPGEYHERRTTLTKTFVSR